MAASLNARSLEPDTVTHNSIISALEFGCLWQEAVLLFSEMAEFSLQPTIVTFNSLLKTCATPARNGFAALRVFRVPVSVKMHSCH